MSQCGHQTVSEIRQGLIEQGYYPDCKTIRNTLKGFCSQNVGCSQEIKKLHYRKLPAVSFLIKHGNPCPNTNYQTTIF